LALLRRSTAGKKEKFDFERGEKSFYLVNHYVFQDVQ
jgi:hypothetical protein